jgi:hypothetical protein
MTMTIAQSKVELAQKVLQTQDKQILKAVELIFSQAEEEFELSVNDLKIIAARKKAIMNGTEKTYTIAEVRKKLLKKLGK